LVAIVIGMPLAKLQRFGEGRRAAKDRFIYDFGWKEEVGRAAVSRPAFDDRIRLRSGVGSWLVRLAPLIRPLVQAKWAARVAARNADLVDTERLDEFLFGARRTSLDQVRGPLGEVQHGRCFYCAEPMGGSWEVDHFLPWSRYPDNTIDNLVAAHARCNNDKSASLAAFHHVQHWIGRFRPGRSDEAMNVVADSTGWRRRLDRVLATARATYLWLPQGTRLWLKRSDYEPLDRAKLRPSHCQHVITSLANSLSGLSDCSSANLTRSSGLEVL
jgi:5-methylcytosine-specific restriction endonuclease McrA